MRILFLTILLVGCSTSYQQKGFTGGFEETRLSENIYRVSFQGNQYTSTSKTIDFTLLRSAELTLNSGYNYFAVIDYQDSTRRSSYTTPTTATTNINATAYGNTVYGTARTTTQGGQTYNYTFPGLSNTILMLKERPSEKGDIYDAKFLYNSIKQKYKID